MLVVGLDITGVLMDNAAGLQGAVPINVDTNVEQMESLLGTAFHRLIRHCG